MLEPYEQNILDNALHVQRMADEIESYGQRNFDRILNSKTRQAAEVFMRLINMRRLYAEALETVYVYYDNMRRTYVQGAIDAEIPHDVMREDMKFLEEQFWHYLALRWDNGEWFIKTARYIEDFQVPVTLEQIKIALSIPEEIVETVTTSTDYEQLRRLLFKGGAGNSPVWSQIQDWNTKQQLLQNINGNA